MGDTLQERHGNGIRLLHPTASLTKTFAAAVVMRLVEAGKLHLDEPFSADDCGAIDLSARPLGSAVAICKRG
jgi:D-alanyl-D-alanine carboxypeptidase